MIVVDQGQVWKELRLRFVCLLISWWVLTLQGLSQEQNVQSIAHRGADAFYRGQYEEAERLWKDCQERWPSRAAVCIAECRLLRGDVPGALEWLRMAAERGGDLLHEVSSREVFAPARQQPQFAAVERQLEENRERYLQQLRQRVSAERALLRDATTLLGSSPVVWSDGHTGPIEQVRFSPDGRHLVSVGKDRSVRLWDAHRGEPVAQLGLHSDYWVTCEFSADSRIVLIVDPAAAIVSVWDGVSGEELVTIEEDLVRAASLTTDDELVLLHETGALSFVDSRTGKVRLAVEAAVPIQDAPGLAVQPSGENLAVLGGAGQVHLYRVRSGEEFRRIGPEHLFAMDCWFLADGRLAVLYRDGSVRIWPVELETPPIVMEGYPGGRTCVGSPDGRRLVTTDGHGAAHLWDAETGVHLATLLEPLPSGRAPRAMDFGAGFLAVTSSERSTQIDIFETENGQRVGRLESISPVRTVSGAGDGRFAFASATGVSVYAKNRPSVSLASHALEITHFDLAADGRVAVGSRTDPAAISPAGVWSPFPALANSGAVEWDLTTGRAVTGTLCPGIVRSIRYGSEGELLIAFPSRVVCLRNDRSTAWQYDRAGAHLRISPDHQRIAVTGFRQVHLLESDGDEVRSVGELPAANSTAEVCPGVFSEDYLLTANADHSIDVWQASDAGKVRSLEGHSGRIRQLETSADDWLLSTSDDGSARLWDLIDLDAEALVLAHPGRVFTGAFSPDGLLVATGTEEDTVFVWNRDGDLEHRLGGHLGRLNQVQFSPTSATSGISELLLTCSQDGTARLWDTVTGELLAVLRGHTGPVREGRFTADGRRVLTLSWDATLRVWDARDGRLLATRVEYQDGGWLTFLPTGHYVAGGRAAQWARLRVGDQLTPLQSYAAVLEDADAVAAGLRGELVPAVHLARAPEVNLTVDAEVAVPEVAIRGLIKDSYGIQRVEITIDGVPLPEQVVAEAFQPGDRQVQLDLMVPVSGRHEVFGVEVRALNDREIWSPSSSRLVRYQPRSSKLFVLAIGVGDYEDDRLDLAAPAHDVAALVSRLEREGGEGQLYDEVRVRTLIDDEVSKEDLDAVLEEFLFQAGEKDTVLVFLAGHGVRSPTGRYYFLTSDSTPARPFRGISREQVENLVQWQGLVSRRRILLLDTCQAGQEYDGQSRGVHDGDMFSEQEIRQVLEGSGLYIVSGSSEQGAARETGENGVFTRALLQALDEEATDRDRDGRIDVEEWIDRAEELVRTGNAEGQRVTRPRTLGGTPFPIARTTASPAR